MTDNLSDNLSDIKKLINFDNLPDEVMVSTMTMTCKLGTNINRENIGRFIELKKGSILSVRYGRHPLSNRTLIVKKKKKNNKKKNFYNQVTVEIKPKDNKYVNVKLFKNGSVQMTGVKNVNDFCEIMNILITELKRKKAVIQKYKLIEKPFVEDYSKLGIYNIKVNMINSNFRVDYNIDRDALYNALRDDNIECTYEPCWHACVNIKYNYKNTDKKISIFVFESGAIIITGANNIDHVYNAYQFINQKLTKFGSNVVLTKLESILELDELQKYLM